ncbi:hypothetical protein PFISCL1PPCAC_22409, partial [Pristionchus fissidentatus]
TLLGGDGRSTTHTMLPLLSLLLGPLSLVLLSLVSVVAFCTKKDKAAVANPRDPNYETMMVIKNKDTFGADKKKDEGTVDVNDPNYQTLQVVGNKDAFGPDKKK